MRFRSFSLEILKGIAENLQPGPVFRLQFPAFPLSHFFMQGPVGMLGEVVVGLGMGHKSENAAAGITDAGDIP